MNPNLPLKTPTEQEINRLANTMFRTHPKLKESFLEGLYHTLYYNRE